VYYHLPLGKVLVPETPNGIWRVGRHLPSPLEYVRAYIDDLLIVTRGTLEDHLSKIETVLT
jgi:hypothetical protein